jgi:hypothetical protein
MILTLFILFTKCMELSSTKNYLLDKNNITKDLLFNTFYQESTTYDVVSKKLLETYSIKTKSINTFTSYLNYIGDNYFRLPFNEIIDCIKIVDLWNKNNGLLGKVTSQGLYVRIWFLNTISINYLKIKQANLKIFTEIQLRQLSKSLNIFTNYISKIHNLVKNNRIPDMNNLKIWEISGLILSSITLNYNYNNYMNELLVHINKNITIDGFIKTEKRGFKTIPYHSFYMKPLLIILYVHKLKSNNILDKTIQFKLKTVLDNIISNNKSGYIKFFKYNDIDTSKYEGSTAYNLTRLLNFIFVNIPINGKCDISQFVGDLCRLKQL